jgi:hypothetical protein
MIIVLCGREYTAVANERTYTSDVIVDVEEAFVCSCFVQLGRDEFLHA